VVERTGDKVFDEAALLGISRPTRFDNHILRRTVPDFDTE
jgi:hypothetical protein